MTPVCNAADYISPSMFCSTIRLEAIATRWEAIAIRLEDIDQESTLCMPRVHRFEPPAALVNESTAHWKHTCSSLCPIDTGTDTVNPNVGICCVHKCAETLVDYAARRKKRQVSKAPWNDCVYCIIVCI